MMRQFDDPDQAVSIVAILFFVGAAFLLLPILGSLGNLSVILLIVLIIGVAQVASGVGLLKTKRWAWPLAVGAAVLAGLLGILRFLASPLGGLFDLLFAGIALYLLYRPAVRERFGVLR
jgi:uncharacterized membrane protein HdeD (DUF308 family)